MNARQQLKPKTIRLAILLALADGAITTIDDLQIRIDEPRKKIVDNAVHAANDDLIKRLRDDVTRAPAYQITAAGRKYLAKYSGGVDEPAVPVIKESLTAESGAAIATKDAAATSEDSRVVEPVDKAARQHHEAAALEAPEGTMSGFMGIFVAQMRAEIATLTRQRDTAKRMFNAAVSAFDSIGGRSELDPNEVGEVPILLAIEAKDIEIFRLADELAEAKASLELSRMARAVTPAGYVTQRTRKPLARFTKAENAQARAMSAARGGKRAQVFALVPVGSAVPGAEWVAA